MKDHAETMQKRGTMHVHPSTCKVKQKYQELIKIKERENACKLIRSHAGDKGTTSRQMKINGTDQ
jgi:hypothetical protein